MLLDKSLDKEFMQKRIDFDSSTAGCWLWTGKTTHDGYPVWGTTGCKTIYAHRFIYAQEIGTIPEGMTLDHLCRVRNCVNPKHMDPCTLEDNIARGDYDWRKYLTHCKRGHEFTPENTLLTLTTGRNKTGGRACRTCARVAQKAYYLRKSEKGTRNG